MTSIPEPQHSGARKGVPLEAADRLVTYEQLLDGDLGWAMTEGSLFFEGRGRVQETLRRITSKLDELGIDYAVAGGMALFAHGFRRFTEDVDILVTSEGLRSIHQQLDGLGFVRPFARSKNLRDVQTKVKIEFLIAGQFPGDGKPNSIAFPIPSDVAEVLSNIRVVNLPTLITLKLASGMTGLGRDKDLADVQELIKSLDLPENFSDRLHPVVRAKFAEIWNRACGTSRRYVLVWQHPNFSEKISSIELMIAALPEAAGELKQMQLDGVTLDQAGSRPGEALLVAPDRQVALKYGFVDEAELMD